MVSRHGSGPAQGMVRPLGQDVAPGFGRGRGSAKGQSRKDLPPPQNGIGKKRLDDIQLLHTETLIKEVYNGGLVSTCSDWLIVDRNSNFGRWRRFSVLVIQTKLKLTRLGKF